MMTGYSQIAGTARYFMRSCQILCCLLLMFAYAQSVQAQTWTNAYFRGTPNTWLYTAMTKNTSTGLWETQQTFTGVTNPRFKISRYTDNWNEASPAADYTVADGTYKITFNDTSKAITVTAVPVTIAGNSICYKNTGAWACLLYTSPSPRDRQKSRMPSSA